MRQTLATLALLAAMLLPAQADAIVDDVLVRREGDHVNVRVNLRNPATTRQPGPVVIDLYARPGENDAWTKITSWNDIEFIQPGYKVSRDFFGTNREVLQQLAQGGRFQVKATVSAPGLKESAEKTSWYNTESGK